MPEYRHKLPSGEEVCTQHLTINTFDTWHLSVIVIAKKMDCVHFLRGHGPDAMLGNNSDVLKKNHLYQIIMATVPPVLTFLKTNGFDAYETEPFRLFGAIENAMQSRYMTKVETSSCASQGESTE